MYCEAAVPLVVKRGITVDTFTKELKPFLDDDSITEICVNGPFISFDSPLNCSTYDGCWHHHHVELDYSQLSRIAKACAVFAEQSTFDKGNPILSGVMPDGHRIQMAIPPATKPGIITLTIRKPSRSVITMDQLDKSEFFSDCGHGPLWFQEKIQEGATIAVCGSTNSGKTTFINAMLMSCPADERVITIEDVSELKVQNINTQNLFYQAGDNPAVTATEQLRNALRNNPDRIILGECRGAEAYDFINVAASGHQGSITSLHAKDCEMGIERLTMMAMQHKSAIPYEHTKRLILNVVDVVIHIGTISAGGKLHRYITEVREL